MRDEMSGFDLRRIVAEMSQLQGAHCKKIYQPHHEQLVLRVKPRDLPQQDIVIVRGKRVYLSQRERPMPTQPSPFAMLLRKHLSNARLTGISQHGFDRIITLDLDSKDGPKHVIIECFRDGNVILTDSTFTIIQPLTHAKYSARVLKKGEPYLFPPEALDLHDLDAEKLGNLLSQSDRNVVRTLAGRASMGGPLANAVLHSTGISADMEAKELAQNNEALGNIAAALSELLSQLAITENTDEGGWLILDDDYSALSSDDEIEVATHAIEATPVLMPAHLDLHQIAYPRFVDAVDAWKGHHDAGALSRRQSEVSKTVSGHSPSSDAEKLERRLKQQESSLDGFAEKVEKQQKIGHAIQNNWTHIQDILSQVNSAVSSAGWAETKRRFKEIPWIESGNSAEGSIVAILPDEQGEAKGMKVTLFIEMSVHQNAQRYFEIASKHKEKSKGAKTAVADTEAMLARAKKKESKLEKSGQVVSVKRTKRLWFENHRWTIVDGMHLMIGGRDAKGNDSVVKKHLKGDDRYFHADLHGAPSCAVKFQQGFIADPHPPVNLPPGIPAFKLSDNIEVANFSDASALQAATMALCWSRGWNGGGGAGTAFWVRPSQVSKQAETGEYVAKGAFIVRGQRNWHKDLRLRLGLGLVSINGIPLLLAGVPELVESLCLRWAEIGPGRVKREAMARKISTTTGLRIDDIVPVIPGNSEMIADHGLIEMHAREEE